MHDENDHDTYSLVHQDTMSCKSKIQVKVCCDFEPCANISILSNKCQFLRHNYYTGPSNILPNFVKEK